MHGWMDMGGWMGGYERERERKRGGERRGKMYIFSPDNLCGEITPTCTSVGEGKGQIHPMAQACTHPGFWAEEPKCEEK